MCIVIDLDETLVHSSFKVRNAPNMVDKLRNDILLSLFQPISNADFIVPVEIDGTIHQVYVLKRPHVDEFLCKMGELFECVLFTASLAKVSTVQVQGLCHSEGHNPWTWINKSHSCQLVVTRGAPSAKKTVARS